MGAPNGHAVIGSNGWHGSHRPSTNGAPLSNGATTNAGQGQTGPRDPVAIHDMNPAHDPGGPAAIGCTAPQLRRFIKSRPYVPMHELRRRFGINGGDDDVTPVDVGAERIFVGLPHREGALLGELLRGGEIGYELSLDPRTPIVVGLYPMRPVARV